MKSTIDNSKHAKPVQAIIGKRITKARNDLNIGRQAFCDEINCTDSRPTMKDGEKEDLNYERLKQWEYGNNPVDLEWIPPLCNALSIDVGYLFGDYDEKTRQTSDAVQETGLSSDAVAVLRLFKNNPTNIGFIDAFICFCGLHGEMLQKVNNAIGSREKISETSFSSSNYLFMESLKDALGVAVEGRIKLPPGAVPLDAKEASEFYIDYVSRLFREFLSGFVIKSSQKEGKDDGQ